MQVREANRFRVEEGADDNAHAIVQSLKRLGGLLASALNERILLYSPLFATKSRYEPNCEREFGLDNASIVSTSVEVRGRKAKTVLKVARMGKVKCGIYYSRGSVIIIASADKGARWVPELSYVVHAYAFPPRTLSSYLFLKLNPGILDAVKGFVSRNADRLPPSFYGKAEMFASIERKSSNMEEVSGAPTIPSNHVAEVFVMVADAVKSFRYAGYRTTYYGHAEGLPEYWVGLAIGGKRVDFMTPSEDGVRFLLSSSGSGYRRFVERVVREAVRGRVVVKAFLEVLGAKLRRTGR